MCSLVLAGVFFGGENNEGFKCVSYDWPTAAADG